jgi:hypothetical protein
VILFTRFGERPLSRNESIHDSIEGMVMSSSFRSLKVGSTWRSSAACISSACVLLIVGFPARLRFSFPRMYGQRSHTHQSFEKSVKSLALAGTSVPTLSSPLQYRSASVLFVRWVLREMVRLR